MDDSVLVFSGPYIEAELAKGLLENSQIPFLLRSQHGAGFVLRAGNVLEEYYIYVRREDQQQAEDVLSVLK